MFRILRYIITLIIVSSLLTVPIGTVAAQEANNTTENVTEPVNTTEPEPVNTTEPEPVNITEPEEIEPEPEPEPTYVAQVDQNVRILDWSYDGSQFKVVFEADRPIQLTLTEAVQFEEGAGQMTIRQERLLPGKTAVSVPISETNGEAAVVITTSASINDGYGVYLSTGQTNGASPFERTSSTAGWIGGAATVGFMFVFVAYREVRKEPTAPEVAE